MIGYQSASLMSTPTAGHDDFVKDCVGLVAEAQALKCSAILLDCFKNELDTNKVFKVVAAEVKALRSSVSAGPLNERDLLHTALLGRIRSALAFKAVPNK